MRLIGVMQNIHHVRTAHARTIIQTRLVKALRFQIGDAFVGPLLHIVLAAEHDRLGRTGLLASWSLAVRNAVGTERALVGLVVDLGDARDVKGPSLHAVAAADAVLVDEIADTVRILHDGTRSRASLEAARIFAMHAAIFADQPPRFPLRGFSYSV